MIKLNEKSKKIILNFFKINNISKIELLEKLNGLSNVSIKFKFKDEIYIIRIPDKNSKLFVDRKREITALELDIFSNEILYIDKKGYKISKFIKGTTLDKKWNKFLYLNRVIEKIKIIQSQKIKIENYNHLNILKKYEKNLKKIDKKYLYLKEEWIKLKKELDDNQRCFSHGDLQQSNIIINNKEIKVIDLEFAGYNHPYYDIACFGNKNFKDAEKLFLKMYSKEEINKLYFWRMFQCLQWHLVALKKNELDMEIKVNFKEFANNYLSKADYFYKKIKKGI